MGFIKAFSGDLGGSICKSMERFKFGGQPSSQQVSFYINLREIPISMVERRFI